MDKEDMCIYTMAHYSDTLKNEILPLVTWMDLEGIMLSGRNQKDKYCMVSYVDCIKKPLTKNFQAHRGGMGWVRYMQV